MRDCAKNFLHSDVLTVGMLSAIPAIGEVTALDRYVAAPDPSYRYELVETIRGDGYAAHGHCQETGLLDRRGSA
jgi:hypothetical protein